jgi:soluble lytic murein transglycosylase-like protein
MRTTTMLLLLLAARPIPASDPLREKADAYADLHGVPRELVRAVIDVESGWQTEAVSSKGAVGLMQLMPATAVTFGVHNRFRADDNLNGGVAYLAYLLRRFHGDLRLVTAAYFAGEEPIARSGLGYGAREVHEYATRVAERYRRYRAISSKPTTD